jgi:hypothetical protein
MSLSASNIDLYLGAVSNLRLVKGAIYEDPHYEMSVALLSFPSVKVIPPISRSATLSSVPFLYGFLSQLRYK